MMFLLFDWFRNNDEIDKRLGYDFAIDEIARGKVQYVYWCIDQLPVNAFSEGMQQALESI